MPYPFWAPSAEQTFTDEDLPPWNRCKVNGRFLPGIIKIDEGKLAADLEHKKAKGAAGSRDINHGIKPAEFTIKIEMYTQEHWDSFQFQLTEWMPRIGKPNAPPFAIVAPGPNAYGVDAILIVEVSFVKIDTPVKGAGTVEMKVKQSSGGPKTTGSTVAKQPARGVPADILTGNERRWTEDFQRQNGVSLPAGEIPPAPPSYLQAKPKLQ